MPITREEAIKTFEEIKANAQNHLGKKYAFGCDGYYRDKIDLADAALAALRPVSRERVERATWITTNDNGCPMYACSACGARDAKGLYEYSNPRLFCYHCGLPMTDEAVDIVLRRLEALHGQKNP